MSNKASKTYHFETPEQWGSCLLARVDRGRIKAYGAVRPYGSFEREPTRYKTMGGRLPVLTRSGIVHWFDDEGSLHRLPPCADIPEKGRAPQALSCASKIVSTTAGLWTMDRGSRSKIELYEDDSFTRLGSVDLPVDGAIDLTNGGRRVFVLVKERGSLRALSFDRSRRLRRSIIFEGISEAAAFTYLSESQRFVVLTSGLQPKLHWFVVEEESAKLLFTRPIPGLLPCVTPSFLGSDSKNRVFLAGQSGGGEYILTFDADGNILGNISIDAANAPVSGLAAGRGGLFATGKNGLLRFSESNVVQDGAAPVTCTLITPVLFSPDREDSRRWLRAEASVSLPLGSTLEISYASTDKDEERERLTSLTSETGLPEGQRAERLLSEEGLWKGKTVFRGAAGEAKKIFSANLFDERDRYLWIKVSMTAASAGASLPMLSKLNVLYPGLTLMENLPSIYQKEEANPDSFLRTLVGVLETTTQGIDGKIASLGSLIDPGKAHEPWLDFVARWLGLPWDDTLSLNQKRGLLRRADLITKSRGTRAGLEAMLEVLFPGFPRRFRLTDPTADHGFATVGGGSCSGSTLPAILGGHARWNTELGRTSVLGRMSLRCDDGPDDGLSGLAGKIRVDVAATAAERKASEPWLLRLIKELVPLTARVELRWVSEQSLRSDRWAIVLASAPIAHLDTDAVINLAHLPDDVIRLTAEDPVIGRRLR